MTFYFSFTLLNVGQKISAVVTPKIDTKRKLC